MPNLVNSVGVRGPLDRNNRISQLFSPQTLSSPGEEGKRERKRQKKQQQKQAKRLNASGRVQGRGSTLQSFYFVVGREGDRVKTRERVQCEGISLQGGVIKGVGVVSTQTLKPVGHCLVFAFAVPRAETKHSAELRLFFAFPGLEGKLLMVAGPPFRCKEGPLHPLVFRGYLGIWGFKKD